MATKIFPPGDTHYPIDTAHVSSIEQYKEIYEESIKNPEAFWANIAERISWYKKWDNVREYDFVDAHIKWFEGGN